MENVKNMVEEIKQGLSQVNSSQKDEVRVMEAMLNDKMAMFSDGKKMFKWMDHRLILFIYYNNRCSFTSNF